MATRQDRMLRVGLIGYGLAGASFHAPLVAATPGMTLAAVATSRPVPRFPDATVHADPAKLIDDDAIDLIVIATPNDSHAPLAAAAIAAGRHVVVDKPFALDAATAAALVAQAATAGVTLSVFHNRRWDADFLTVAALLREGTLGKVRLAELCWDRFRPAIKPGWRESADAGAGLLADLGPHLIDQALTLFGAPERVTATIACQRAGATVDDMFALDLRYGDLLVRLCASSLVAAARPRFALHGEQASFVKHGIDPQEAVLRADGEPTTPGYGVEPADAWGLLTTGDGVSVAVPSTHGDWRTFYAAMRDSIILGTPVPVDPNDAVLGLHVIAAARASAAEGGTPQPL